MLNWFYGTKTSEVSKPIRKYGWNHTEQLTEEESAKFAYKVMNYHPNLESVKEVNNFAIMPEVKDQGHLGSCTANSICANYESQMIKLEKMHIPMSRLFLYYLEREREGNVDSDSGAQIKDGVAICNDTGLCLESLWPYDIDKFAEKPPANCYDDLQYHKAVKIERVKKNLKDIDQCLLDGHVISMGFKVYESFESEQVSSTGIVPLPDVSKEKLLGGHAVCLFGKIVYGGKTKYLIRNSWGKSWGCNNTGGVEGDRGNFMVDPEFLTSSSGFFGHQELCSDFWTIKVVVDDKNDPNIVESNEEKLAHIKKILGITENTETAETNAVIEGIKKLVAKVELKF